MSKSQRTLLIAFVVLIATGFAVAAAWLSRSEQPAKPTEVAMPTARPAEPEPAAHDTEPRLVADTKSDYGSLETTVAFPLRVTLELVRADDVPRAEGAAPLGSGATARIKGSIHDARGEGVRAEISFAAGTNRGRVLYCDRQGQFGANDLYPGISIVRVTGPGILGSMREVRLRQDRDSLLNIGYGRPAHVFGQVFEAQNKPLSGAKVTMDGQESTTDDKGLFEFTSMTSGEVLVIVEKPGYAAYRESVNVVGGSRVEPGQLKFLMAKSARLQVTVVDAVNSGEKALLFLLPEHANGQRKFPWHLVNPTLVYPGGTVTIEDLPAGNLTLRLFHAGAIAKPASASIDLVAGETVNQEMHLDPAPVVSGVVTEDGAAAAGATVRMEVPDRMQGMLSVFGQSNYLYLESEVFPNLPPASQEATTNARGEYSLSSNASVSRVRYVTAISRDGRKTASAILKGSETRIDLALQPNKGGNGEITIQMQDRFQPLPVQITIDGEPKDPIVLPTGKDLHIEGLATGAWLMTIDWNTDNLMNRQPVQLKRDPVPFAIVLPDGAIQGQDADTLKRVGRR